MGVWDNDAGFFTNTPVLRSGISLGTAAKPFANIYVENLTVSGSIIDSGSFALSNNVYLRSVDFAGTGFLSLVKGDASDNTVINAKTAKKISLAVNGTEVGSANATAITYPKFNLTDGSDKNYTLTVAAAGTAYSLTATYAAVDFGTTDPSITLDKAGTYLILGQATLRYNGATFAATRAVSLKLRRTNNTAADLTNSDRALDTAVVTTVTATFMDATTTNVIYTTTNTNDVITIFGKVAVVPTAGSLDVYQASLTAIRLY